MSMIISSSRSRAGAYPRLLTPLAWPVRLVPGWLQRGVLEQVLNLVFREALED